MIQALDADSVRKLCAGQVLSSIKGVVKELIENSLDAGATVVEVVLESHGLESVSVRDNGHGIPLSLPPRLDANEEVTTVLLAQRATSKRRGLQETSTLSAAESCDSLGFRGEALHSLAQLADVVIETKSSSMPHPVRAWYDRGAERTLVEPLTAASSTFGLLMQQNSGTVVRATNIFVRFPVRRQELDRNKKKQLQETVGFVKQYALSRPDVRLIVEHRPGREESPVTLCSTSGSGDMQRSLAEAFGGRMVGSLKHIDWQLTQCDVAGLLSPIGSGRATGDLQVFALDGRLVELPRLAKVLLDVFRDHHPNAAQRVFPVFFLQLKTGGRAVYDVNLTPDKRKVLLAMEDTLVDDFRKEADKLYRLSSDTITITKQESMESTNKADDRRRALTLTPVAFTAPSLLVYQPPVVQTPSAARASPSLGTASQYNRWSGSSGMLQPAGDDTPPMLGRLESVLRAPSPNFLSGETPTPKRSDLAMKSTEVSSDNNSVAAAPQHPAAEILEADAHVTVSRRLELTQQNDDGVECAIHNANPQSNGGCGCCCSAPSDTEMQKSSMLLLSQSSASPPSAWPSSLSTVSDEVTAEEISNFVTVTDESIDYRKRRRSRFTEERFPTMEELEARVAADHATSRKKRKNEMDAAETNENAASLKGTDHSGGKGGPNKKKSSSGKRKAVKAISAQTDDDLSQVLHKSNFTAMQIHGQFNHGFILASHEDDLFIIDQHASDEKYNYEQLMEKYVARPQPLVRPVRVAMDAHEVELALEHRSELRKHGFLVQSVEEVAAASPSTQPGSSGGTSSSMYVASVPVLPYDTVTPQDILELTQQLLQYGAIVKPIRAVWHSTATKACRSSIMIGTVLNDKTMRDIVNHLSTMHQPWNCPHGRPTLRHLGVVSHLIHYDDEMEGGDDTNA